MKGVDYRSEWRLVATAAALRPPERQNVSDKRQFLRLAAGVVLTAGVPCCVGAACDCGLTKGMTLVVFVSTHPSQTLLAALWICYILTLLSLKSDNKTWRYGDMETYVQDPVGCFSVLFCFLLNIVLP